MNEILDNLVMKAHKLKIGKRKIHPYFLFTDLSIVFVLVFTYIFSIYTGQISFYKITLIIIAQYFLYEQFVKLKLQLFGIRYRTIVQDFLYFILPTYILGNLILKNPILPALDLLAFNLCLVISTVRLGCFFGGCCHGYPCKVGVKYPLLVLQKIEQPRKFTPSNYFDVRVFPLQLLESIFCYIVFAILFFLLLTKENTLVLNGTFLLQFLMAYCSFRFITDFFKLHRGTKNIGKISQTQIASCFIILVCGIILWLR